MRVHAVAGPPRAQDLARLDPGRRPAVARVLGDPRPGTNDYEMAHTAALTQIYPLFETAPREAGRMIDEHQRR